MQGRRSWCWRVFIATIVSMHVTLALPSAHLTPEMSDALHLLSAGEEAQFTVSCLAGRLCSPADVMAVTGQSFRSDPAARERFWHTYACMRSQDQDDCPVDGGWSAWGEWGDCDTTCGDGTRARQRACDWPPPSNGGHVCHGQATSVTRCRAKMACPPAAEDASVDSVQQRAYLFVEPFNRESDELRTACMQGRCSHQQVTEMITPRALADDYWTSLICYKHLEGCAVDGGWSVWSAWSSCSSQCGTGKAYRSRRCTEPRPRNNGRDCQGPEYEEGACFDDSCVESVGVLLTPWSMWSECSATCNEGVRTSTRRCHGSQACDVGNGRTAATLTREMPCTERLCSEDGGWSVWSDWTVCTALCSRGYRLRERACVNPRPQGEGSDCQGDPNEVGSCDHNAPFCDGIPTDVQMYEQWSYWSHCSSDCDGGVRIRHRTCPEQAHPCRGELYDLQVCNQDTPCQVDGGWAEWTQWSVCTVTCGRGQSERHRQCSQPRPQFGGQSCPGDAHETKSCQDGECPASAPTWESWGAWSRCTVTCGGGTNTRTRGCVVPGEAVFKIARPTAVPTSRCAGEYRQTNICNFLPCPVDGNWASWGDWGGCSQTCGEGVVTRDRTCTDPAPVGGGSNCGGYGTEVALCYRQPCPEPDEVVRSFDGAAFLMYRHAAAPTRHLLVYVKFKPSALNGLLALRHHSERGTAGDQAVSIGVSGGHVRLFARIGGAESEVASTDVVRLDEWNEMEVAISGAHSAVRLNDGVRDRQNFSQPLPARLDWDQAMFVGGALPNLYPGPAPEYVGFVGEISAVRVNYKEYTLHDIKPEWTGVGLPFVSFNADARPADTDSQVTVFTGDEFTFLPRPETGRGEELSLRATLRPDGRARGIVLHCKGRVPGSFASLSVADARLVLTLSLGDRTYSARSTEIQLSKWVIVQVTIKGKAAEMRVNGGPAVQLAALAGSRFATEAGVLYVGGVPATDRSVALLTAGTDRGLQGALFEVTVNRNRYRLSETALSTGDMHLNSASTTLSAHYKEVRRLRHSSVLLNCTHSIMHSKRPVFTWLHGDEILENSEHLTIVKPTDLLPRTSTMSIHKLSADNEGLYACMVWYRGKAAVIQAFGISVYELHFVQFRLESSVELMVVGNLLLIVGFVLGICALSCCKICRNRFFFLDMMYQSIVFYLGLDACACLRGPNVPDRATVLAVSATYDRDFSAREEKLKFDRALKETRRPAGKLRQKARQVKRILTRGTNGASGAKEKAAGQSPSDCAEHTTAVHFSTTQDTNELPMTSSITVKPNQSSERAGIRGKSGSTRMHQDRDPRAGSRGDLQRRPSVSLSDAEIGLRCQTHEIVTGRPASSTSASSPGDGGEMTSRDRQAEDWESPSSLVLEEGEKLKEQGGDGEEEEPGSQGESEEEMDEPVYVNVQTIRERRHQTRGGEAPSGEASSAQSSGSESPPALASPDTRQKLQTGEALSVDMDEVRRDWQRSRHDGAVVISSDPDAAASRGSADALGYPDPDPERQASREQRRSSQSVARAADYHEAGRLFSHRGSVGGALAKLSEAVADEVDGGSDDGAAEEGAITDGPEVAEALRGTESSDQEDALDEDGRGSGQEESGGFKDSETESSE